MKTEQNRYCLVEYCGYRQSTYNTEEELNEVLNKIRLYNNRPSEPYLLGNLSIERKNGKIILTGHLYNKLTPKTTITQIDNLTSQYDEKGLIKALFDRFKLVDPENTMSHEIYYPDISIAYLEDKNAQDQDDSLLRRIKYIDVMYADDQKYLNSDYVKRCLGYHAREKDTEFFKKMSENFSYNHSVHDELDSLDRNIDRVINQGYGASYLFNPAYELYRQLIVERERNGSITRKNNGEYQISRRRQRDFGFFIRNYNSSKRKDPTKYSYSNSETKHQDIISIREEVLREKEELVYQKESKLLLKQKRTKK